MAHRPWKAWKEQQYQKRRELPCFWCGSGLLVHQATVDHLVSRQLCKKIGKRPHEESNFRLACRSCQDIRAALSFLHSRLRTVRLMGSKAKCCDRWMGKRGNFLEAFGALWLKYVTNLNGEDLKLCMLEWKEVVEFNR